MFQSVPPIIARLRKHHLSVVPPLDHMMGAGNRGRTTFPEKSWYVPDYARQGAAGVCVIRNLTETKRAERALRESEHRLRLITDALPALIAYLDSEQRYRFANATYNVWFGRAPETLLGHTARELVGDAAYAQVEGYLREALAGHMVRYNSVMPYRVGPPREVEGVFIPDVDGSGRVRGIVTLDQDVSELSERKRTEMTLRTSNAELAKTLAQLNATQTQLVRSEKLAVIGTLAGGVAHEINNPLMGVMGYVDYARRYSSEPPVQDMLDEAKAGLERIGDLVKRLVAASTPLYGEREAIALPSVLAQVLAARQHECDAHGITVDTAISLELPPVQATKEGLEQVFTNLLTNACDALANSTERRIHISARREDDRVVVAVSDSGPGIPPETQQRIFDPFFTTKQPGKGTGLGLPIARNVVEALGGTITCNSEPGRGATFTVVLPAS